MPPARFTESGGVLNAGSPAVVIHFTQPFTNHNGGDLDFGPDGYLYWGLGDGGDAGDPDGNGQNLATWMGALLRLDVVGQSTYAVPPDNPFVGAGGGTQPEIFAYGLRNPWRFSFDPATGVLWLADVGQGLCEEVDRIVSGANYGWNTMEGLHCYNASSCSMAGLTLPVAEYAHSPGGNCSISGGAVYRGSRYPGLAGLYFYGDYCSGRIWAVPVAGGDAEQVADTALSIVGFAQDADGELLVIDYAGGRIHRLVPNP